MKHKSKFTKLQEQFTLGQKIANLGIWTFEHKTGTLEWTEGVHQIFGTDSKTFGASFEAFMGFVHPDDKEELQQAYNDSITHKSDYYIEHRIILTDGSLKYVEERCENFFDDAGDILHSTGTVLDITKQKKLEYEILQINRDLEEKVSQRIVEQQVLLSLFDKGDSVLFKWNNDDTWTVAHVSDSIFKVLGYDKEDFLSDTITYASCIHEEDLDTVFQEVKDAIAKDKEYFEHKPYRVYTKDRDIKWIHDSTVIVRDENDNIINFVGYISDITELKEKDRQLLQQSRMAQMGEMISMIAHQWRQPLGAISTTSIDMNLKLQLEEFDLVQKEGRDNCRNYFNDNLGKIDSYVQSLTNTIDDFRNFYKPDKESTNALIHAPVSKALSIVGDSFKADGIKITKNYRCKNEIAMHENELMQVILNILKNAQDNFKDKKIQDAHIMIDTYDILDKTRLEIYDNGGGIPEDILEKIFDPYFSTKNEKNGTGLGLYMSKTIVETHHDGKFYAENRDDGVCFFLEMKRKKVTVPTSYETMIA